MDHDYIYSIRMRASAGNRHISGAERIVPLMKLDATVQALIARARGKQSAPDQIVIKIERLGNMPVRKLTALDVVTVNVPDIATGRSAASRILQSQGISEKSVRAALNFLSNGGSSCDLNLRGAMVIDVVNGDRLEPDHARGIRASRFDWTDEALDTMTRKLAAIGLTHFRTREALALATKVAQAPGIIAELCWSDDPDYTAGYVASPRTGYVRFPALKLRDDPRGGRVFFVDRNTLDIEAFINYLQFEPVLIVDGGICRSPMDPEQYFRLMNHSNHKPCLQ